VISTHRRRVQQGRRNAVITRSLFASSPEIAASYSDMRSRMLYLSHKYQYYRHSQRDRQGAHRYQRYSHPPSRNITLRKGNRTSSLIPFWMPSILDYRKHSTHYINAYARRVVLHKTHNFPCERNT
jgi:hypothetical protein